MRIAPGTEGMGPEERAAGCGVWARLLGLRASLGWRGGLSEGMVMD